MLRFVRINCKPAEIVEEKCRILKGSVQKVTNLVTLEERGKERDSRVSLNDSFLSTQF